MRRRAATAYVALFCFYVLVPHFYGELEPAVFRSAVLFTSAAMLLAYPLTPLRGQEALSLSLPWWRTLKWAFWASHAVVLAATASVAYEHGFALTGLSRDELFRIREASLGSLTVTSIYVALATAGALSLRHRTYAYGLVIPVVLEILTQSRGFILSALLVLFVCRTVSKKMILPGVAALIFVTVVRISEPLDLDTLTMYIAGEALNTAMGNLLISDDTYSVSLLQGMRVLFAPVPFLGTFLDIRSEALVFNEIVESTYGFYGLAFGVLGFSKFAEWPVMCASLISAFIVFWSLIKLRTPKVLLLTILAAALPTFFRWSPAEFFFVSARVAFVLMVCHYFLHIFRPVRSTPTMRSV